jgi:hypothetical protein
MGWRAPGRTDAGENSGSLKLDANAVECGPEMNGRCDNKIFSDKQQWERACDGHVSRSGSNLLAQFFRPHASVAR